MDWQRFSFEYRLRLDALTPGLIRIEASREAALNLVLPPDWKAQLDQLNRVRAVYGTRPAAAPLAPRASGHYGSTDDAGLWSGIRKRQEGPGARPRRASSVAKGTASTSAQATYQAS